ncbi:hypothetical protein SAZ11_39885 [Streptomyces sp. FXJ1.4098]|nr:hypothetical protein [Streptomyces sp. FXJ1.4098]
MFELGDLTVRYPRHDAAGDGDAGAAVEAGAVIGLEIFPTALADRLAPPRDRLPEDAARHHPDTGPARHIEPLAAVARAGDPVPEPFAGVRTLRRTATTAALRLRAQRHTEAVTEAAAQAATEIAGQTVTESAASPATEIVTELSDGQGLLVVHRLTHRPGDAPSPLSLGALQRAGFPRHCSLLRRCAAPQSSPRSAPRHAHPSYGSAPAPPTRATAPSPWT